jgi:lipoate-protein ligase A
MGVRDMKYIKNDSNDPYYNMAFEEYIVKFLDPKHEYFLLWQNSPTVVIGRNQNTIEEVNLDFTKNNNIAVVRRLSGGGAVYHDLGNINFTYVVDYTKEDFNSIERFAQAIIKALEKLGVKAEFTGRNDITVNGKKISGNAQYLSKGRLLHHGTILFDSDLGVLSKALKVKKQKIISKGIKSVSSRVTNIKQCLKEDITIDHFKELIARFIFEVEGSDLDEYKLSQKDIVNIRRLRAEKYSRWEWNFGHSPEFNLSCSRRFAGGHIDSKLNVKDGIITEIKFYGDFMSIKDIAEVEVKLKGSRFTEQDVINKLSDLSMREYFGLITVDQLLDVIFCRK